MLKKILQKLKRLAGKIVAAVTGLIVAILAAIGIYIGIPPAETATITITYERATEREDGTPLRLSDIQSTKLFCDGELVATEPGADGSFEFTAVGGVYECAGSHVDLQGRESNLSNTISVTVPLVRPKPPVFIE